MLCSVIAAVQQLSKKRQVTRSLVRTRWCSSGDGQSLPIRLISQGHFQKTISFFSLLFFYCLTFIDPFIDSLLHHARSRAPLETKKQKNKKSFEQSPSSAATVKLHYNINVCVCVFIVFSLFPCRRRHLLLHVFKSNSEAHIHLSRLRCERSRRRRRRRNFEIA